MNLSKALPKIANMLGWGGVIVGSSAASSYLDTQIKERADRKRAEYFGKQAINCKLYNFGCIQNLCWANCGPRLRSSDWCLTTNSTNLSTDNISIHKCKLDTDCDPCWKCASTCNLEGSNILNAPFE